MRAAVGVGHDLEPAHEQAVAQINIFSDAVGQWRRLQQAGAHDSRGAGKKDRQTKSCKGSIKEFAANMLVQRIPKAEKAFAL